MASTKFEVHSYVITYKECPFVKVQIFRNDSYKSKLISEKVKAHVKPDDILSFRPETFLIQSPIKNLSVKIH
jgi:hypothetical protein